MTDRFQNLSIERGKIFLLLFGYVVSHERVDIIPERMMISTTSSMGNCEQREPDFLIPAGHRRNGFVKIVIAVGDGFSVIGDGTFYVMPKLGPGVAD